jgi:murein DD-endopeptidase MepM/ murein hydrolase activator NlpD
MIENKHLYPYNSDHAVEIITPPSSETDGDERGRDKFYHFLMRCSVCILTLLMIVFISQSRLAWARRAKSYLHTAIYATSRQTFGRFADSPWVTRVLEKSRSIIRPEYFTRKLRDEPAVTVASRSGESWVWPVRGRLIRKFGWSLSPENRSEYSQGIAVSALPGEKIIAAYEGTVKSVTRDQTSGWNVVIDHGDAGKTVYQNLGYVYVEAGQYVNAGAPIAKMRQSGASGDSVLHFELWEAGKPVDPLNRFVIH